MRCDKCEDCGFVDAVELSESFVEPCGCVEGGFFRDRRDAFHDFLDKNFKPESPSD